MHEIYRELLYQSLIIWIDDILGHADTQEKWFQVLETTLKLAQEHDIKFNLEKCELFQIKAKFCGRIFTPEGVRLDPARVEALVN
ncbi:hypothetical protein B5P43_36705, partial [Bacillus sp. SRB_336]